MNDKRTIPCSVCGAAPVVVADYMEGDEHEVVCDACEEAESQKENK